jgi:isopenicillin N synthase-like dioxygenase
MQIPDWNEAFDFGHDPLLNDDPNEDCKDAYMQGDNVWPRQLPGFEQHLSSYYRLLRSFGRTMAKNIALSLNLTEDYFDPLITHPGCSCVIAHYPPQPEGVRKTGLDPHTDAECKKVFPRGRLSAG